MHYFVFPASYKKGLFYYLYMRLLGIAGAGLVMIYGQPGAHFGGGGGDEGIN